MTGVHRLMWGFIFHFAESDRCSSFFPFSFLASVCQTVESWGALFTSPVRDPAYPPLQSVTKHLEPIGCLFGGDLSSGRPFSR